MIYRTFKEWKQDGYIVKKGERATKVSDDHKPEYLFSEDQVVLINKKDTKINNITKKQKFIDFVNWSQANDEDEKHRQYHEIISDIFNNCSNKNYEDAYYRLADLFEDYLDDNNF